jgi:hypothetical protein
MSFMLDMDPAELAAPLRVLDAVIRYQASDAADPRENQAYAVNDLRVALDSWLVLDRRACVALLGPGLGLEQ